MLLGRQKFPKSWSCRMQKPLGQSALNMTTPLTRLLDSTKFGCAQYRTYPFSSGIGRCAPATWCVSYSRHTVSRFSRYRCYGIRTESGVTVYHVPSEDKTGAAVLAGVQTSEATGARLSALCRDLLLSAEGSGNIAVLRTPPGAAQFLASAIDHARLASVLGSIAGDDSIMVVTRLADGGSEVASEFIRYAEQEPRS